MLDEATEVKSEASTQSEKPMNAKTKAPKRKPPRTREASTIVFPYRDLEMGISVAQAIMNAGGVALTTEQLAGVLNLQAGSGNFVMKVATARIFGLIASNAGKYELTVYGFGVTDTDEKVKRGARAMAFLSVPLYRRVYDEFKGRQLPPRPHGLAQAFVRFGVSAKQKDAARLAFDRSANQAGFFSAGPDRLVEPIIGGGPPNRPPSDDYGNGGNGDRKRMGGESEEPDVNGLNPFIQGLLETLPEPHTTWTIEGRAKWLQAAANIFDLIYKGAGDITITSKSAPESKE